MNIFELPVHPAADIFPMLDLDELSDLAADIKANGLRHPIVIGEVDGVEMLIDGRNRLAACKLAGVEPESKQLNGHDPEALILSENIMRRNMTNGQRAMAIAKMYPAEKGGRGKTSDILSRLSEYKRKQISYARTVINFAPEHCDTIVAGAKSLSEAYEEAKQRKNAGNDDTDKLVWLKGVAPELADRVVEGDLTLVGAIAEHYERESIDKAARGATLGTVRTILNSNLFGTDANREALIDALSYDGEAYEIIGLSHDEIVKQLSKLQQSITVFLQEI